MNGTSKGPQEKQTKQTLLFLGLVGMLPFLYFAVIGLFDWSNVTATDYEIGAFFYSLRTPLWTAIATAITRLADRETQILVAGGTTVGLFVAKKWKTGWWYGLTALLGAGLLNGAIKIFYQRMRPDQIEHLVVQGGYSFPSGHAMGSVIIYGGLLVLVVRYFPSNAVKWGLTFFIGMLTLSIGLSRIYLGVHFPSDVIGGFSLGFMCLTWSLAFWGLDVTREEFRTNRRAAFKDFSR